jgi:hypothetical protein
MAKRVRKNIYDYGYQYMVQVRRNGHRESRCFTVSTYGGRRKALQAATEWRVTYLAHLPPKRRSRRKPMTKAPRTSRSGILGVFHHKGRRSYVAANGKRYYFSEEFWQATARTAQGARHRRFSVRKHGFEGAKRLAIAARKDMEREFQALLRQGKV